ncbi:MAG: NAD(P)-dependent dehydrogenase (short-subunit alcohol dehydrogenase family) [Glaciecola sp.]|jgi:NAD(P)-dependent dehydrogenase (short-subunit alcohol dehydrogenase family)|uniref:SDR family NAD(P)-dependent oxidoreductase n=1 Tax=Congregibacter sp. TaxID=2744308 RepID=UPI0039E6F97D
MKVSFKNKTCVITGAAGGIGRELALELARRGARLAISDVDSEELAKTESDVRDLGVQVHAAHLDVADHASIYAYAESVEAHFGEVHQLYNNAGVSGMGELTDMSEALIQRVIDINFLGVLHGCRAFLPLLEKSGKGALVNISSLNGFAGMPGLPVYCATKFAVRGLTEALRADALLHGTPMQIVCVHPGGIKTNIARANVGMLSEAPPETHAQRLRQLDFYENKLLTYPADKAARDILRGVARGKSRIVITRQAKMLDRISRLFPAGYLKIMNKYVQRELVVQD